MDTDRNYLSFADCSGVRLVNASVDPRDEGQDPAEYDDLLKLSNASNFYGYGLTVAGGGRNKENGLDLNRHASGCHIEQSSIEAGQQCAVVIKGASNDSVLQDVLIIPAPGNRCDIEYGGRSMQVWDVTTGQRLVRVRRSDGRPLRVVCGRADWPQCDGTQIEKLRWESFKLWLYCWLTHFFPRL